MILQILVYTNKNKMDKYCNEKSCVGRRLVRKPYISKDHITQGKKTYQYINK